MAEAGERGGLVTRDRIGRHVSIYWKHKNYCDDHFGHDINRASERRLQLAALRCRTLNQKYWDPNTLVLLWPTHIHTHTHTRTLTQLRNGNNKHADVLRHFLFFLFTDFYSLFEDTQMTHLGDVITKATATKSLMLLLATNQPPLPCGTPTATTTPSGGHWAWVLGLA